MSDLGWRADGIERALAAGGVPLEIYRRPGFAPDQRRGVRRSDNIGGGQGVYIGSPGEDDPDPEQFKRRRA